MLADPPPFKHIQIVGGHVTDPVKELDPGRLCLQPTAVIVLVYQLLENAHNTSVQFKGFLWLSFVHMKRNQWKRDSSVSLML